MPDPPFVNPRRECPLIADVYPGGTYRICNSNVHEVEGAPHLVWCKHCQRYSLWKDTRHADDPLPRGAR